MRARLRTVTLNALLWLLMWVATRGELCDYEKRQ